MKLNVIVVLGVILALFATSMVPMIGADDYPPFANVDVEAIPEDSVIDMLIYSDFTIRIYVDPNYQDLDTASTDYLYWTPGMMNLVNVQKGDLFGGTTAEVGVTPVTPLPDSSIAMGNSKNWNMSLPCQISQLGGDKTGVVIYPRRPSGVPYPFTRYLNYSIDINGVEVENDVFAANWTSSSYTPANTIYSYLEDWSGLTETLEYMHITITVYSGGADHTYINEVNMFSTDSHKRFLAWGHTGLASDPGDFMELTFVPLKTGMVNFYMGYPEIIMAFEGSPYPISSTNCSFQITAGDSPVISDIFPGNNSINIDPKPAVRATFTDPDLDSMEIYINVTNADSGVTSDHWVGVGNGQRTISTGNQDKIATFGKTYYWEVWVSDGWNPPVTANYSFTLRDQHVVGVPTGFTATAADKNSIDLEWSKGDNATHTIIIAKLGSYPVDRADGAEIYNGTGIHYLHDGCNPEESWYYRIWGWDDVDEVVSATYAQDTDTTPANAIIIFSNENPVNGSTVASSLSQLSITITDPDDGLIDYTIECSNGQSAGGSGVASGTKTLSLAGLTPGASYIWWVNATDDESATTSEWYTFDTFPNLPVVFSNENPANGSINRPVAFTWSIAINDADGDPFDWTIECSNGQSSNANGASNGTKTLAITGLLYSTTYTVWVNATDTGSGIPVNEWFDFTTIANQPPNIPTTIYPANNATNVDPEVIGWRGRIQALVSDPEGHDMIVQFYWGNGTLFYTDIDVRSGQLAEGLPGVLEANTQYYWYINITDEYGAWTIAPAVGNWTFTTGEFRQPSDGGIGPGSEPSVMFLVVEEGEEPVIGAVITVQKVGVDGQVLPQSAVLTAYADQNGRYEFNVYDGYYLVSVQAPGYETYEEVLLLQGHESYVIYLQPMPQPQPIPMWLFAIAIVILIFILYGLYTRSSKKRTDVLWNLWK
jgi:hypothetical protein